MKIHPVTRTKGSNRFCGPAVISSLLKVDTAVASQMIRSFNGKRSVMGTSNNEVFDVLKASGINVYHRPVHGRPTLAGWLKQSKDIRTAGRVFLIIAGNHWQLVSGRRYVCGRTTDIVSVRSKEVKRRARVHSVFELRASRIDTSWFTPPVKAEPPAGWAKLRKLADEHGIDIDVHTGYGDYFVYPPEQLDDEDLDPAYGEHHCADKAEALSMVRTYLDLLGVSY